MNPETLRLYLVTDEDSCPVERILPRLADLARAGVSLVQLRDKRASTRVLVDRARRMKAVLSPLRVPLVINDRADVAFAVKADGVHVGNDDLSPEDARELLGPDAIIGVSVESVDAPLSDAASYFAASPVFSTPTKTDTAPPLGYEGVRALVRRTTRPVVGIGGLSLGRLGPLLRSGAAGAAVVSAILGAPDPLAATTKLRREIDTAQSTEPS